MKLRHGARQLVAQLIFTVHVFDTGEAKKGKKLANVSFS